MQREIVLDTETTGLDPSEGHKLVEIGAVEVVNKVATGKTYHQYINPKRDMPPEAYKVHGLGEEFLADKPVFAEIVDGFLAFIADSPLVIHNAKFDIRFLDHELRAVGREPLTMKRAIDTLSIAQQKFPGSPNNLDFLCRRFEVDGSKRVLHGALLDSELLAEVYMHLCGGRQTGFELAVERGGGAVERKPKPYREPRSFPVPEAELAAHAAFVAGIKNAVWNR